MFTILDTSKLLLLNKYVQGIEKREEVVNWIISNNEESKQRLVQELWMLAIEAGIRNEDIDRAAINAGLKLTHTPVVMLKTGNLTLHKRGYDLVNQRGIVLNQALLLVLECFAIAERRRKENECGSTCNHWWHKDLSDEKVVKEILENM